ncbi:MAG: response regulator transcription factor [Desulfobacterales bacterium]|nr:response regulator transcription factor [Desulfobacterales bacterium]
MLKTLIVEDSATFRKTFKEALCKRFPFMAIDQAVDGAEAMQKIKTFLPDLVFMDIRLPGASGLELTKRIKASHPEIAIIILTAYDLPEYREAAYDGGADAFIPKSSLKLADIAALIESIFSDRDHDFHGPTKEGGSKKRR